VWICGSHFRQLKIQAHPGEKFKMTGPSTKLLDPKKTPSKNARNRVRPSKAVEIVVVIAWLKNRHCYLEA